MSSEQETYTLFNLYEKGLLSGQTLLSKLGFDPEKETTQIKKEREDGDEIPRGLGEIRRDDASLVSMRVEQARRNLEALTKFVSLALGDKIAMANICEFEKVKQAIDNSVKAMDDVSNIK
jgi:hypothetical protein